jgi:hypothetical protein
VNGPTLKGHCHPPPSSLGGECPAVFSPAHRNLLRRAIDEAEEYTSGHYCIPPRGWEQLRYDLITRKDGEWDPLPESALARVQRVEQVSGRRREGVDFFRIQLNDPTILDVARREKLETDLYPFLVYILTHEMVHMVRLGTILNEFCMRHAADIDKEEDHVDRVSRRILVEARRDLFTPVLERVRRPCK